MAFTLEDGPRLVLEMLLQEAEGPLLVLVEDHPQKLHQFLVS